MEPMEPAPPPPPPSGAPTPMPPPSPLEPAAPPPERSSGWPRSALIVVIAAALLAIGGLVLGQVLAKQARDDKAEVEDRLAAAQDDADAQVADLQSQLDEASAAQDDLQQSLDQANADLADAQTAADDAAVELRAKQATINDLTRQLELAQAAAEDDGGSSSDGGTGDGGTGDTTGGGTDAAAVFPVQLEDLNKLDMSAAAMPLNAEAIECTYDDDTCSFLENPTLDADIYRDNGQWNVTMRDNGVPYFQAALVLDASGSFSGSEYVNADGTCASGEGSKPFATIYLNPVEYDLVNGTLRATRIRGYLEDSMECGDVDPHSTLVFEGRVG